MRTNTCMLMVDGANIYATAKKLGYTVDYDKLRIHYEQDFDTVFLRYYTATVDTTEHQSIRPMLDFLEYHEWTVITKSVKDFVDADTGVTKRKGNMDCELVVDALEFSPYISHLVLFTGDGDFRAMVEAMQRRGVHVTVVSSIQTRPAMVADELRRQANKFVDLSDILKFAGRQARG